MIFVNTVYEVKLILGTVENLPIGSAFAVLFFVVAFLKKKKKKKKTATTTVMWMEKLLRQHPHLHIRHLLLMATSLSKITLFVNMFIAFSD